MLVISRDHICREAPNPFQLILPSHFSLLLKGISLVKPYLLPFLVFYAIMAAGVDPGLWAAIFWRVVKGSEFLGGFGFFSMAFHDGNDVRVANLLLEDWYVNHFVVQRTVKGQPKNQLLLWHLFHIFLHAKFQLLNRVLWARANPT